MSVSLVLTYYVLVPSLRSVNLVVDTVPELCPLRIWSIHSEFRSYIIILDPSFYVF